MIASSAGSAIFWAAILMALSVAAVALVYFVRRYFLKRMDSTGTSEPFTLQDLREMKDRGELSDVEFNALRGSIIDQHVGPRGAHRASGSDL